METRPLFYGVKNIYLINHGDWADPEIMYNNYLLDYYDLENTLNEEYIEAINSEEISKNTSFNDYIKQNQDNVYEILDNMISEEEDIEESEDI